MIILSGYLLCGLILWMYLAQRVRDDIKNKALWWEGTADDWAFVVGASLIIIMFWPAVVLVSFVK